MKLLKQSLTRLKAIKQIETMKDHVTPACGDITEYDNNVLMIKAIIKLTAIKNAQSKARKLNKKKPKLPKLPLNAKKSA